MPEGSSDTLRIAAAAGTAVGLAAAAVALGFVIGRGTAPGASLRPAPTATPGPSVPPRSGPTIFVAGVPVGYAATKDGAIAAATAYQQYLFGDLLLHPDDLRKAVAAVAAPEKADAMVAKFQVASNVLEQRFQMVTAASKGIPTEVLTFPLTTQVRATTARTRWCGSTPARCSPSRGCWAVDDLGDGDRHRAPHPRRLAARRQRRRPQRALGDPRGARAR